MKTQRTVFPAKADFSGWWIKSKKGAVGQLVAAGRNLHDDRVYKIQFENGQLGGRAWAMSELSLSEVQIHEDRKDLKGEYYGL